jgi:hypothetical protein
MSTDALNKIMEKDVDRKNTITKSKLFLNLFFEE